MKQPHHLETRNKRMYNNWHLAIYLSEKRKTNHKKVKTKTKSKDKSRSFEPPIIISPRIHQSQAHRRASFKATLHPHIQFPCLSCNLQSFFGSAVKSIGNSKLLSKKLFHTVYVCFRNAFICWLPCQS